MQNRFFALMLLVGWALTLPAALGAEQAEQKPDVRPSDSTVNPADTSPLIEIGVSTGIAGTGLSDSSLAGSAFVELDGDFNLADLFTGDFKVSLPELGRGSGIELNASAEFLLFHLYDLTYRSGDSIYGDQTQILGGIGSTKQLPGHLGKISASLGALFLERSRAGTVASMVGAYAGVRLEMKVWKIEGKVKIAYYLAPRYAVAGQDLTIDDVLAVTDFSTWKKGFLSSGSFFFDAFELSSLKLGPELSYQFQQMPDGTEFRIKFGVSGKLEL